MPDGQPQIAELCRRLERFELLHTALGKAAYIKAKADLETQLQPYGKRQ